MYTLLCGVALNKRQKMKTCKKEKEKKALENFIKELESSLLQKNKNMMDIFIDDVKEQNKNTPITSLADTLQTTIDLGFENAIGVLGTLIREDLPNNNSVEIIRDLGKCVLQFRKFKPTSKLVDGLFSENKELNVSIILDEKRAENGLKNLKKEEKLNFVNAAISTISICILNLQSKI